MRQDDILPDGRFVTDKPNNNTQTMLNYSYAGKDNRVYIRYGNGEQDIDLCEYIAQIATSKGCKRTANDIIEGDCMECDCEVAVLYAIAVQAAELREKLRLYEDINPSPQALEGLQMRNAQRIIELEAEVDRLKKDNEYILMQHRFQRRPSGDCWNDVIEKAKADVTWAIFDNVDEIAYRYLNDADYSAGDMIYDLNELKKKYTEGNQNVNGN